MYMDKYPVESDFLDSYLNHFVLKTFYNKPENYSVIADSIVFNSCVHMNAATLKLANCADRRNQVENFITKNEESFNKFRNIALENCKSELASAHGSSLTLEKDAARRLSGSELNFLSMIKDENEQRLFDCINKSL